MQREEHARRCAAHLQTLGIALQAYQQHHNGELPRKFICPPNDRRLTGGWSDEWNEASLGEGITDRDTYFCSSGGCYTDRIPLLLRDGPRKLMRPEPESVILYCNHHAKWGGSDRWGEFIGLRLNGVVERVAASDVEFWRYGQGRWYRPDEEAQSEASKFVVFPDEPWPPQLEEVAIPFHPNSILNR